MTENFEEPWSPTSWSDTEQKSLGNFYIICISSTYMYIYMIASLYVCTPVNNAYNMLRTLQVCKYIYWFKGSALNTNKHFEMEMKLTRQIRKLKSSAYAANARWER